MKRISIFKVKEKKGEKYPDYNLVFFPEVGDAVTIGSGWSRESKTGTKFISVEFSKPYKGQKGYKLMEYEDETQG